MQADDERSQLENEFEEDEVPNEEALAMTAQIAAVDEAIAALRQRAAEEEGAGLGLMPSAGRPPVPNGITAPWPLAGGPAPKGPATEGPAACWGCGGRCACAPPPFEGEAAAAGQPAKPWTNPWPEPWPKPWLKPWPKPRLKPLPATGLLSAGGVSGPPPPRCIANGLGCPGNDPACCAC